MKKLGSIFTAALMAMTLLFSSCNNDTPQWARIGIESGNSNNEIYRKIPTQFWVTAPSGEEIYVRANKGIFLHEGKEIDAIKGVKVIGLGENKRIYLDVINPDRGDLKIDVSYPNTGTNSLELQDAIKTDYIEIKGQTYSAYSEIYYKDNNPYLRITILASAANTNQEFLCYYTAHGFMPHIMDIGYVRGEVPMTSNDVITQYLEPLSNREDMFELTTFTQHSIALEAK